MVELAIRAWLAFFEARDWAVDLLIRSLCVLLPWRFRVVPDATTGLPMLRQLAIIRGGSRLGRRYGALYLQHFERPEPVQFAHVHRWEWMKSFVLSGAFIEERFEHESKSAFPRWTSELVGHVAGESYSMDRTVIHRVAWWSSNCWTLFRMSPEISDDWGWYPIERKGAISVVRAALIPWRQHIAKRVPSLDTGKVTQ